MVDAIKQILNFLIRGYPLREIKDDILDIQKKHKVHRNIIRLLSASCGIILGIVGPNLLVPGINEYLSNIFIKILPINLSSLNLTMLATFFCMWVTTSIALLVSKHTCRLFNKCKHGDTNSSHRLEPRQIQLIAMDYKNHLILFSPDIDNILSKLGNDEYFIDRVKNDTSCMVDEVKKLKKTIKFNSRSEQQQKEHADQKKDLKAVLGAYILSDFFPYDEYLKLYEAKRKTNQDRLLILRQNKLKFRQLDEILNGQHQTASQSFENEFSISNSHLSNNIADQSVLGSPEVSKLGYLNHEDISKLPSQSKFNCNNIMSVKIDEYKSPIDEVESTNLSRAGILHAHPKVRQDKNLKTTQNDEFKQATEEADSSSLSRASILQAQPKLCQNSELHSNQIDDCKEVSEEAESSQLSRTSVLTNNVPAHHPRNHRGSTSTIVQFQQYSKLTKKEMQTIQQELDKQISNAVRMAKDDNLPARRLSLCQPQNNALLSRYNQ